MKHSLKAGFTIIELLVVIAIIGVLAGFGIWAGSSLFRQSNEAKYNATAASIRAALVAYQSDNDDLFDGTYAVSGTSVVFGSVDGDTNRLKQSNVEVLMKIFGRDVNGNRQSDQKAYMTDTSMLYYYSGSGSSVVKLDEAKSISANGVIGFPITMRRTSDSKYKAISGERVFAPIKITVDYDNGEHITVTVPKDGDFKDVIKL